MNFKKLRKEIQKYFHVQGGHTFDHTERVYNAVITIAKNEKADLEIVKAAALLHDIARKEQSEKKCNCHAEKGATMAKKILTKYNFPKDKIDQVCYAIKIHRKSSKTKPKTKEEAILQDADRLDALGAIDISRIMVDSVKGEYTRSIYSKNKSHKEKDKNISAINYLLHKIKTLKPNTFNTKTAKKLAKRRYDFTKFYTKTFIDEWEGKY